MARISNMCPSGPEFNALVNHPEIGLYEAMREWMDNDGEVGTVEQVLEKLQKERSEQEVEFYRADTKDDISTVSAKQVYENNTDYQTAREENTNANGISAVQTIAQSLSDQLGVQFEFVTPEAAARMTENADVKWTNEPAFFFDDKVYFVGKNITMEMVFHEFGHPFMKAIMKSNPKLAEKLYTDLMSTPEGVAIDANVKRLYPNLDPMSDRFREEVMVRSLEKNSVNIYTNNNSSTGFAKFIKDILYQIKKALKSLFGKVNVSKLGTTTSMKDLAEMLVKGEKFDMPSNGLSEKGLVDYQRYQIEEFNDLYGALSDEQNRAVLTELATVGYQASIKSLKAIRDSNNPEEMFKVLKDELGVDSFEEIKKNLAKYTAVMNKRLGEIIDEMQYTENHIEALINTFYRLSNTMPKITKHLESLIKEPNDPKNLKKAFDYGKILTYWGSFINAVNERLEENKIRSSTSLVKLVSSIKNEIDRAQTKVGVLNGEGLKDVIYTVMKPVSDTAGERFQSALRTYEKYNASQGSRDRAYIEYHGLNEKEWNEFMELKNAGKEHTARYEELRDKSFQYGAELTDEKIQMLLSGQIKDVGIMNSWFEPYLYNDDALVGGFSLFVKNALDEVDIKNQMRMNEIATDLVPMLEKIGYNARNVAELGDKTLFKDVIGSYVDGKLTKTEVWTFLNPFKDYRWTQDDMNHNIREAYNQWIRTNSESDKQKWLDMIEVKEQHDLDYMNNEYVDEFYQVRRDFTNNGKNKVAVDALAKRDLLFEELRKLQEQAQGEDELFDINSQLEELWSKVRMLESIYDINGKLKTDEVNTKEGIVVTNELSIAKELQRYKEMTKKFYRWEAIEGAFDTALAKFEQSLKNKGITGEAYDMSRDAWITANSRVQIKSEFFQERRRILQEIREILAKSDTDPKVSEEISELYSTINQALTGFRDEDGQPNGSTISKGRAKMIKDAEKKIEQLRKKTKVESKILRSRLKALWAEYDELSTTEPTDYYMDQLNNWLGKIKSKDVKRLFGDYQLDHSQAQDLISSSKKYNDLLVKLLGNNDEFAEWFHDNHLPREKYNGEDAMETIYYKRSYLWNVTVPSDPEYFESYTIKDSSGNDVETMNRIPKIRFYRRVVKDEFKTGYDAATGKVNLEVGKHIDNKGNWLPKLNGKDDRYINKDYFALESSNKDLFDVLEKLKDIHLNNQKGAGNYAKLYYDMPRYEQERLEILQGRKLRNDKEEGMGIWQKTIRNIREFFSGTAKDAPENNGVNWSDEYTMAKVELMDNGSVKEYQPPVSGLYDIEADRVSKNVLSGILRYMVSIEKSKKLNEIHPVANAFRAIVNNPEAGSKMFKKILKTNYTHNGQGAYSNKDLMKNRRQIVNGFIDREFYGIESAGVGQSQVTQNIVNGMFQVASMGYFAFNIQSSIKNSVGQQIQNTIEAAGGQYYGFKDLAVGRLWSANMMRQLSMSIYDEKPRTKDVQIFELFDPFLTFEDKARKQGMSRTFLSDIVNNPSGVSMNFRKWSEMQAGSEVLGAMLNATEVDYGDTKIRLLDAWEVVDGKIRLKEGVDPEWGVTYDENGNINIGSKLIKKKNEIQAVLRNISGSYDRFNQPFAGRYLAYKVVAFLRKYLTTMVMDRLGGKLRKIDGKLYMLGRTQVGLGNVYEGYYWTFMRLMKEVATTFGKKFAFMTPEERRSIGKVTYDFARLMIMQFLIGLIFNWDPKDEERFEKLRQKSGPLPGPFTAEQDEEFNANGWLSNHALNLLLQINSEQQSFIPLPKYGLDDYIGILNESQGGALFGPTVESLGNVAYDIFMLGNERGYYQADVGPYDWQQEGGMKLINHTLRPFGITGTFTDPIYGIKKWESAEKGKH